jgi:hypothetical protein
MERKSKYSKDYIGLTKDKALIVVLYDEYDKHIESNPLTLTNNIEKVTIEELDELTLSNNISKRVYAKNYFIKKTRTDHLKNHENLDKFLSHGDYAIKGDDIEKVYFITYGTDYLYSYYDHKNKTWFYLGEDLEKSILKLAKEKNLKSFNKYSFLEALKK